MSHLINCYDLDEHRHQLAAERERNQQVQESLRNRITELERCNKSQRQQLIAERASHQQVQTILKDRIRDLQRQNQSQGRRRNGKKQRSHRKSRSRSSSRTSSAMKSSQVTDSDSGEEGLKKVENMFLKNIDEADDEASSEASTF